jgi:hypothetical protein
MLTLMRLRNIQTYPIGSDQWKKEVYKYVLSKLKPDEETELRTNGSVVITKEVGPCSDRRMYRCTMKISIVGTTGADTYDEFTYVEF